MVKTDESYLDNLLNTMMTSNPTSVKERNTNEIKEMIEKSDKKEQSEIKNYNTENNRMKSITINKQTGEKNKIELNNEIPIELKNELKEQELIKELKTDLKKEIEEDLLNQRKLTKEDDMLFSEEDLSFDKADEEINDLFDSRQNEDDINIKPDYNIFDENDSFIDNLLNDNTNISGFLNNTNMDSLLNKTDIDSLSNDDIDRLLNEDSKKADELLLDFEMDKLELAKEEISTLESVYEDKSEGNNLLEDVEPLRSFDNELETTFLQEEDEENLKSEYNEDQVTNSKQEDEYNDNIPDLVGDLFQDIEDMNETKNDQNQQLKEEDMLPLSNNDAKIEEDILSINDFMDETGASKEELEDSISMDDPDLSNLIPDIEERELGTKKTKRKKKPNVFKKIFGNLPDKRSDEEIEKLKEKTIAIYNEKEQSIINKKDKKITDKKLKAELKKQGAVEAKAKKTEVAKEKAEKAKIAKEKKAAKKDAKLKKQQEIQNLMDEIDNNVGRINKVGASIIFILFIIIATTIVIGTNIMTYNKSIEDAKSYFDRNLYNEAMNLVYGLEIIEEDMEFYDQVLTVMYVNQQYNAYINFSKLEMYPEALHSLLKGLIYYDKFYQNAVSLGIESDLNIVREKILTELGNSFDITEQEATRIINYNDKIEYSDAVYYYADLAK